MLLEGAPVDMVWMHFLGQAAPTAFDRHVHSSNSAEPAEIPSFLLRNQGSMCPPPPPPPLLNCGRGEAVAPTDAGDAFGVVGA